jgi:membrane protein
MKLSARTIWLLLKDSSVKFVDDDGSRLGAALAYYTALSLSPLLLALLSIVGLVFGANAARGEIAARLTATIGTEAAKFAEEIVLTSSSPAYGTVAGAVTLVVLFFGAAGVFAQVQHTLNIIWRVPGRKPHGIIVLLRERLLSFALVCVTGVLILASLVVSAGFSAVTNHVAGYVSATAALTGLVNFLIAFAIVAILFAMIFKWLPETDLGWSDVWLGRWSRLDCSRSGST